MSDNEEIMKLAATLLRAAKPSTMSNDQIAISISALAIAFSAACQMGGMPLEKVQAVLKESWSATIKRNPKMQ